MDYRAEIARCLHSAAQSGVIPARVRIGKITVDFGVPAECCFYVDHLLRSDWARRRWGYMGRIELHGRVYPGLQPALGECISELRDLEATEYKAAAREVKLGALRAHADYLRARHEPFRIVHAASTKDAVGNRQGEEVRDA